MQTIKLSLLTLFIFCTTAFAKAQPVLPPSAAIDKITNAYLDLKNALVNSDGGLAQVKAKNLLTQLSANPEQRLKPEQKKLWATYIDKLNFDSRHISETADVAHQREHFASLSKNMFAVLKKLKLNTHTIYQQYCPMKRSIWISETVAIRNPYYGPGKMADCGTTQETL